MTPAQMFDGDLYVLASDAVQMATNAYKNGQTDEREACAKLCDEISNQQGFYECGQASECSDAIRVRGQE